MTSNKVLALYDITGIQDFIYASSRLKENIGASRLVGMLLDPRVLEQAGGEVIYSGGGNALAMFDDKNAAIEATRVLAKRSITLTCGALRFAVAYQEMGSMSFTEAMDKLGRSIRTRKREMDKTGPMLGIGITKLEHGTNLPVFLASNADGGRSRLTGLKLRVEAEADGNHLPKTIMDISFIRDGSCGFEKNLDKFFQKKGEEGYIAVCHVDGNDIGELAIQATKNENDLNKAKRSAREFSDEIQRIMHDALKNVIESIHAFKNGPNAANVLDLKNGYKDKIPFYPVVSGGDDLTFITNGLLGISAAELFLNEISNKSISVAGRETRVSACAGVAIVKTKFPFNRAYSLANWLCTNAKNARKATMTGSDPASSWLDFQVVTSSAAWDVASARKNLYMVPGMATPAPLTNRAGTVEVPRFNLLRRPYCVTGGGREHEAWKNVLDVAREFRSDTWPRSKLMDLRAAFYTSKEAVNSMIEEFGARNLHLPSCGNGVNVKTGFDEAAHITPYIDAMELVTYYNELQWDRRRG